MSGTKKKTTTRSTGKKSTRSNSRRKSSSRKKSSGLSTNTIEILYLVLMLVFLVITLGVYFKGTLGIFGAKVNEIFVGLFGFSAYLISLFSLIVVLLHMFGVVTNENRLKIIGGYVAMILLAAFLHLINGMSLTSTSLMYSGATIKTGGVVGGVIGSGLASVLGKVGGIVVVIVLFIISGILITGRSIVDDLRKAGEKTGDTVRDVREQSQERAENQRAQREERARQIEERRKAEEERRKKQAEEAEEARQLSLSDVEITETSSGNKSNSGSRTSSGTYYASNSSGKNGSSSNTSSQKKQEKSKGILGLFGKKEEVKEEPKRVLTKYDDGPVSIPILSNDRYLERKNQYQQEATKLQTEDLNKVAQETNAKGEPVINVMPTSPVIDRTGKLSRKALQEAEAAKAAAAKAAAAETADAVSADRSAAAKAGKSADASAAQQANAAHDDSYEWNDELFAEADAVSAGEQADDMDELWGAAPGTAAAGTAAAAGTGSSSRSGSGSGVGSAEGAGDASFDASRISTDKAFSKEEFPDGEDNPHPTLSKEGKDAAKQEEEKKNTYKGGYMPPSVELLKPGVQSSSGASREELIESARKLESVLLTYGVKAEVKQVNQGPAVTRYELQPAPGVSVKKITGLDGDIAMALAATTVHIEAPIPGKSLVGIEIPNKETTMVTLREVIDSDTFRRSSSKLTFALGKDIDGQVRVGDIAKMPHMLIAGTTGSGKSVCINSMILSLLYKASPDDVKLILIDPKVVELQVYNGIPHLLLPVVNDPKQASATLNWAVQEMTRRYKKFADFNVRDIKGFNAAVEEDENERKMPQIVIIIDELADLMMVASKEVETSICRLAQMARAAGMHIVIATQRPSVDVITGLIKANVPSRIAFAVSSGVDSKTILDGVGAEKLLGKGDMLFAPIGANRPVRIQGTFVSDEEVERVVEAVKKYGVGYDDTLKLPSSSQSSQSGSDNGMGDEVDEYLLEAAEFVIDKQKGSISMLQRRFRIGFNRAARLMDALEEKGVVGPDEGSKPRQVLMTKADLDNLA